MGSPLDKLTKVVQTGMQTVEKTVEKTVKTVEQKATEAVKTAQTTVNQARQVVQGAVDTFERKAAPVVRAVEQKVHAAGEKIESGVEDTERMLHDAAQKAVDTVKPVVERGVTFVQATADSLAQAAGIKPTPDDPLVIRNDQGSTSYGPAEGQLFVDGASPGDIRQGGTGDCYFLSSMASLAQKHPEKIQDAITQNPDGTYTVTFHVPPGFDVLKALGPAGGLIQEGLLDTASKLGVNLPERTVQVTVDGDLPLDQNGNPTYSRTPDSELWPAIMEKAYAKLWGSYGAIGNGGDPAAAMRALTGGEVTHHSLDSNPLEALGGINVTANPTSAARLDAVYDDIKAATDASKMVVAATYGTNSVQQVNGVVGGHAYTVMGVAEENGQKFVVLRNPWGSTEPGNDGNNDGVFRMPMDQFVQQFSGYDVGEVP